MSPRASLIGRGYLIRHADGRVQVLQEIELHCEACGDLVVVLDGHHLVAMRDLLNETIARYPQQVQVDRLQTTHGTGDDPAPTEKETLN